MKLQQAILQSMEKIARKIACRVSICLIVQSALLQPAFGANQAILNINFTISKGMAPVLNLTAMPSAAPNTVSLSWTEPNYNGATDPRAYDIRVSSTGQISNDADFSAAQSLSAFSPSPIPAPGTGGGQAAMSVTGLQLGVVYYFAIREYDSTTPTPMEGDWTRDVAKGWNVSNFAAPLGGNAPAPVADLGAAPGTVSEGDLLLSWTAPVSSTQAALGSYDLRYATFSIAGLGGNASAWFAAATYRVSIPTATSAGIPQSYLLRGLWPDSTYYFALKSADLKGNVSPIDLHAANGPQAQAMPLNLAPAAPKSLAASAGLNRAVLSWTAQVPLDPDFAYYRVQRSTYPNQNFVDITTTTAAALTDKPLTPFVTYYYRVSARDQGNLESAFSSTVAVTPFNIAPLAPQGVRTALSADGSSTTFSWSPVASFQDGSPFDSTGTPTVNELQGYRVLRSTAVCNPNFTLLSTAAVAVSSFTDYTAGDLYYYQIQAFNTAGISTQTLVLSSVGEQNFFLSDCMSRMTITDAQAAALSPVTNGQGAPIGITSSYRPADVGGEVFQSVQFQAVKSGAALPAFHFDSPTWVVLHYSTGTGGGVVPAGLASPQNLGVYWFNGAEYKKLYGHVDPITQTVAVQTPNTGIFQIRALLRSSGAVFDISNLSGRVFTPNGDGKNDMLLFAYDPGPNNVVPTGKIYDLKGQFVSDMLPGLVPNTLTWDGRMNGKVVTSGVYIYEIKGDGKTFNGTVVVAR